MIRYLRKIFPVESFSGGWRDLSDCWRTDAAGSIRRMLQQCHTVLKDNGCMMLLDKADGKGESSEVGRLPDKLRVESTRRLARTASSDVAVPAS